MLVLALLKDTPDIGVAWLGFSDIGEVTWQSVATGDGVRNSDMVDCV